MRRLIMGCVAGLLGGLLMLPCRQAPAQAEAPAVKIAVVNTLTRGLPAAIVSIAMRPLKAYMESETGMAGEIVLGGDALELGKKLEDDQVQIGVFHGHEFAWAKKKFPKLEPIVVCLNDSRNIRAVQIVLATSKAESHADLKGTTLALPRENRAFCRLYAERRCVTPACTLEKYYKDVTNPIDCEDALDAVGRGKVDSAIVEASLWESYQKNKPAWAKYLRVLQESEIFPPGVIAYKQGKFTAKQADSVRNALINAGGHAQGKGVMKSMRVSAFASAPEKFADILDACFAAYPAPAK
jgi:ABC-type phosphate/phosphonate transport system substrate-binding protein